MNRGLLHPLVACGVLVVVSGATTVHGQKPPSLGPETVSVVAPARTPIPESPTAPPHTPLPTSPAGAVAPESSMVAPVPTPALVPPTPVRYQTPYSLNDCLLALDQALQVMPEQSPKGNFDRESMTNLLESVSDYLKDRDDLHSTLIGYQWERIARGRVTSGLIGDQTFIWKEGEMPSNVSALSFEVEDGDVIVHNLQVFNDKDELVGPFSEEVVLRHSIPRRYVFHLYQPTTVKRVLLACSQAKPRGDIVPRLTIHAGRTDKPEHGKTAIHYIWKAEEALAAQKDSEARTLVLRARGEITLYRHALLLEE